MQSVIDSIKREIPQLPLLQEISAGNEAEAAATELIAGTNTTFSS
jgi:hypothetical protein